MALDTAFVEKIRDKLHKAIDDVQEALDGAENCKEKLDALDEMLNDLEND